MQFKSLSMTDFQVKFASDNTATIEGYASTFGNMDFDRDIVMPGAFKDTIVQKMPAMLYQHQTDKIAGIWNSAEEDSKGLIVRGHTLNTTLGKDAAEELRSGALKTLSIGYGVKKDGASYDKQNNARLLKALNLHEVSLVTFPANEKAIVTNVKAALEDIDTSADLVYQAMTMLGSVAAGALEATPEILASVMQTMQSAYLLLEEPDEDDESNDVGKSISQRALEKHLRDAGLSRKDARVFASVGYKAITPQRDAGDATDKLISLLNQF